MNLYAIASLALGIACLYFGTRRARNRRVGLPPPSHACKRNSVESVP